jgi:hypothetical protein
VVPVNSGSINTRNSLQAIAIEMLAWWLSLNSWCGPCGDCGRLLQKVSSDRYG